MAFELNGKIYDITETQDRKWTFKWGDRDIYFTRKFSNLDYPEFDSAYQIIETFFLRVYSSLFVKDKVVVDIGAAIGDTAIYFALKGAKQVISVDVDPIIIGYAKQNVALNHLEDKVILINAACGGGFNRPKVHPSITLSEIVEKYQIPYGSALKVDCEGGEYDIIVESEGEAIKHFSDIIMEYHLGPREMPKILEKLGFVVDYDEVQSSNTVTFLSSGITQILGYLRARLP
jgi:hypothetical protein